MMMAHTLIYFSCCRCFVVSHLVPQAGRAGVYRFDPVLASSIRYVQAGRLPVCRAVVPAATAPGRAGLCCRGRRRQSRRGRTRPQGTGRPAPSAPALVQEAAGSDRPPLARPGAAGAS